MTRKKLIDLATANRHQPTTNESPGRRETELSAARRAIMTDMRLQDVVLGASTGKQVKGRYDEDGRCFYPAFTVKD